MGRAIRITPGAVSTLGELNDSATATAIWNALPILASAQIWGDEIDLDTDVVALREGAREVVEAGDLGCWPPGRAFCIFFGPTPASLGEEIRPARPVNLVGRVVGDPKAFKNVRVGAPVAVERG